MAYLTFVSATKGRKFGFATVIGVTLGLLTIGFAAAAGLATAISKYPILYQGLRVSGVIYLGWLAYEEWQDSDQALSSEKGQEVNVLSYLRHGLFVNILNPKAGVFYITILPTFIESGRAIFPQASFLTLVSVAIATLIHIVIVSLASLLKPMLIDRPSRKRFVRRVLALMLFGIALWFGLSA